MQRRRGEGGSERERETDRISQGSDQTSQVFMKAESHDTPVPLLGADKTFAECVFFSKIIHF